MNSPSEGKGSRFDKGLIIFSILGIMIFLYFINDDQLFKSQSKNSHTKKIGAVLSPQRDVRRRYQEDFLWVPLNDLEEVFQGDAIFTGNYSSTLIQLDTGVKLWIDPDSLVVLDNTSDLVKLDLKFGHLRGNLGTKLKSPLKLKINNQDLDLEGQSVEFFLDKGKSSETKLKVTEGIANITETKSKKVLKIAKSQHIEIARETASVGNLIPEEDQLNFINQDQWASHRNVWFAQKQPLKFSWQTEGPVDHYEIIISKKSDFSDSVVKEFSKASFFEWIPDFDEGFIFWKIKAVGINKINSIESNPIQWRVGLLIAPEWKNTVNPRNISLVDLIDPKKETNPENRIEWYSTLKTTQFRLEWSADTTFAVRDGIDVKQNSWKIPKLPVGRLFFRVRSEGLGRPSSLWSIPLILNISDTDPDGLVAPILSTKEIESLENVGKPTLEWPIQDKAKGFLVELSNKFDFSKVMESITVSKPQWIGSPKSHGVYFLRVIPLSEKGRRGPTSEVINWYSRSMGPNWKKNLETLEVRIPRDASNKLETFPETKIEWTYQGANKALNFQMEQDLTPDFMFTKTEKLGLENSYILKSLLPGEYYFRVRAQFENNEQSMPSKILKLEVIEDPLDGLSRPSFLSLNNTAQIIGKNPAIGILRWKNLKTPFKYIIQMSDTINFKNLILEEKIDKNSYQLNWDKIGKYYVRVAGVSKNEHLGPWSSISVWNVTLGPPEIIPVAPVKIELSQEETTIPETFVNIQWNAPNWVNQFLFEIGEDKSFSKSYFKQVVKESNVKVKVTKNGLFKMRVRSLDQSGIPMSSYSKIEDLRFFINRPLSPPALLGPNNKVSYMLSKEKAPQIWLEWDADKLSTSYKIQFSKDIEFKNITHFLEVKERRILLGNKVIRGKNYWRVQGINEMQGLESPWSQPWSLSVVDIENED